MDEMNELTLPTEPAVDLRAARRSFSRIGWGSLAILAIGSLAQVLTSTLVTLFAPMLASEPWALWVFNFAPLYLLGFTSGILILRRGRRFPAEGEKMSAGFFFRALLVGFFFMYAGNLVGTLINSILQTVAGLPAGNPIMGFATDDSLFLKILVMVVLAPCLEELIFRRMLIDRMAGYGEKLAVVVSALMFGLFHGNLAQFFYAFGLGLVFGYVYLRTRQLRWTILMHMLINCLGSVVAPALLAGADLGVLDGDIGALLESGEALSALSGLVGYMIYAYSLLGLGIAGLVIFIKRVKTLRFDPALEELPRKERFKTVALNAGMILFTLFCLAEFVIVAFAVQS